MRRRRMRRRRKRRRRRRRSRMSDLVMVGSGRTPRGLGVEWSAYHRDT